MDEFGCDYECRTVGESVTRYNIPDDWCAEFDANDDVYPIIVISVEQIRKSPMMMGLQLKMIEYPDDEYARCILRIEKQTIVYKVDSMSDLVKAMATMVTK